MTGEQRARLSKLMSALLRHIPWEAGLRLDRHGWVGIDELVDGIRRRWRNSSQYKWVTREHVVAIALLDPKGRFEIRNSRIRAAYGHSVRIEIDYKPVKPPKTLYHGTVRSNLKSIMEKGLLPMRRLMVHLSLSVEDAVEVARRHGKDIVILTVSGDCLSMRGIRVYKVGKKTYAASWVPPECIRLYSH